MQIQLKQDEIIAALRQYITKQGLSLSAKEVVVSFTAGRSGSGLSADIIILDDVEMPNTIPEGPIKREMETKPVVVQKTKVGDVLTPPMRDPKETSAAEVDSAKTVAGATSLFG